MYWVWWRNEGKRSLGRIRRRKENNIKMNLKNIEQELTGLMLIKINSRAFIPVLVMSQSCGWQATLYQTRLLHYESVPIFVTVLSIPINHEHQQSTYAHCRGEVWFFMTLNQTAHAVPFRFLLWQNIYQRLHHIRRQAGLKRMRWEGSDRRRTWLHCGLKGLGKNTKVLSQGSRC